MDANDLPEDREERRKLLTEKYGLPRRIHAGDPLRALDLRDTIHPSDVIAFVYPSLEAYNVYQQANQRFNSFATYGPLIVSPTEIIGVLDYRSVLPILTDPACSDDTPSASAGPGG